VPLAAVVVAALSLAASAAPAPSVPALIGQKLVVRMDGTTPSASLLARVRRGQIGGVILFPFNVTSAAQLRSITANLQQAAAAGGQPKLLIAVDQEGGPIRTIPWAPPTLSPRQLRRQVRMCLLVTRTSGLSGRSSTIKGDPSPATVMPSSPARPSRARRTPCLTRRPLGPGSRPAMRTDSSTFNRGYWRLWRVLYPEQLLGLNTLVRAGRSDLRIGSSRRFMILQRAHRRLSTLPPKARCLRTSEPDASADLDLVESDHATEAARDGQHLVRPHEAR
jgi:hypothetical protein